MIGQTKSCGYYGPLLNNTSSLHPEPQGSKYLFAGFWESEPGTTPKTVTGLSLFVGSMENCKKKKQAAKKRKSKFKKLSWEMSQKKQDSSQKTARGAEFLGATTNLGSLGLGAPLLGALEAGAPRLEKKPERESEASGVGLLCVCCETLMKHMLETIAHKKP